jgi:threonine aldolase
VQVRTLPNLPNGMLDPVQVEGAIRDASNPHYPLTRAICLENTHNRCGGTVLSVGEMAQIKAIAERHGLYVHLDGARIFNAAIALGVPARDIAAQVDTVQICLSKGLAAPVGSLVLGSAEFIRQARRSRKVVGGGMRQAGIMAAAGILALEQMVDRMADDHANARTLAEGLASIPGLALDLSTVQTNIVRFTVTRAGLTAPELSLRLLAEGVLINAADARSLRAVTHYGIEAADIARALSVVQRVLGPAA